MGGDRPPMKRESICLGDEVNQIKQIRITHQKEKRKSDGGKFYPFRSGITN